MTSDECIQYFANDRFANDATGIEILEVTGNYAKTRLKIKPKHRNANNVVMGGCIYTLADYTFALASNCENPPTTTLSSNIVFNAPAFGDELYAVAEVIKNGRSICTFDVKVFDEKDVLIATVMLVGFRKS